MGINENTQENKIIILNYKWSNSIHYMELSTNLLEDIADEKQEKIKSLQSCFITSGSLIQGDVAPEKSTKKYKVLTF